MVSGKKYNQKAWVKPLNIQKVAELIRLSKANYYDNCFKAKKLILHKTWQGIKVIINITKKTSKEINCLKNGQRNLNELIGTANIFNVQFSSKAEQIEKKNHKQP